MKTCGQCIIYAPDMYGKNCNGCSVREYEGEVSPDTIACGRYISRQEFLSHFSRNEEGEVTFQPARPEDNSASSPVLRYWAKNRDIITEEVIGLLPYCPSCNMMTVGKERCEYCGQPFIMDKQAEQFFAPKQTETGDCPFCGAKGAYHYVRHSNGKAENGRCSVCGTVVMDYPHGLLIAQHEAAHKMLHESAHEILENNSAEEDPS